MDSPEPFHNRSPVPLRRPPAAAAGYGLPPCRLGCGVHGDSPAGFFALCPSIADLRAEWQESASPAAALLPEALLQAVLEEPRYGAAFKRALTFVGSAMSRRDATLRQNVALLESAGCAPARERGRQNQL